MSSNQLALRPTYWASVSGGKDSLYMLNFILHHLDRYPLHGVVHFELEIDFPFVHRVIDYMESECKRFGIPFYRIKPRVSWFDLYERHGFPMRKVRWCNDHYKMDSLQQLKDFMAERGCSVISYIGYCADEKDRADGDEQSKQKNIYPLIENGVMEDTILEWAKTQPIFNDYYKFNRRCGCMWCPLASMDNHAYLLYYYPKEYEQMMELARRTEIQRTKELGRPFSVWQGNPKYDTVYRDARIRSYYLPKLIKSLSA